MPKTILLINAVLIIILRYQLFNLRKSSSEKCQQLADCCAAGVRMTGSISAGPLPRWCRKDARLYFCTTLLYKIRVPKGSQSSPNPKIMRIEVFEILSRQNWMWPVPREAEKYHLHLGNAFSTYFNINDQIWPNSALIFSYAFLIFLGHARIFFGQAPGSLPRWCRKDAQLPSSEGRSLNSER